MTKINNCSEWWKWDLHVHTPDSIVQFYGNNDVDTWNLFIEGLEALPEEFKVLGINDYLFIDGYKKVLEEKKKGRLNKIDLILPVVEFRIEKFAGVEFGKLKRINLHVVFSNELEIEIIESQFLEGLSQAYKIKKDNIEWNRKINRSSVEDLGKKIKESIPASELPKYTSNLEEGFNNLNFNENKIFELLKRDCFSDKFLIGIGKTEWDDLKWTDSSIAIKKSIINKAHIVFTAAQSIENVIKSKSRLKEQNVNDILLDCSDAHYFANSSEKARLGNCFTWIKSEHTFEGLKQIIYDPESRISLSENEPVKPNNVVDSISLKIPEDAKISVQQIDGSKKEEKFCFADIQNTYYLSPYFNCFIGGRGSGKSTILNFLGQYSKDPDSSEKFWEKIQPSFDIKDREFFTFNGVEVFEFIGQSEVESFATNTEAFTRAIYERANIINDRILEKNEKKLLDLLNKISSFKSLIIDINELHIEQSSNEKEKRIFESSIEITKSSDYTEIIDHITVKSNKRQELEKWRTNIDGLRESVQNLQKQHFPIESKEDNEKVVEIVQQEEVTQGYQDTLEKVKKSIELILKILEEDNFKDLVAIEESLSQEISDHEDKLSELLKNAGLSEENILQVKSAPQKLVKIINELSKTKDKIDAKKKELGYYGKVIKEANEIKSEYEEAIHKSIEPLVTILEEQAQMNNKEDVKNIGLNYFFDEQQAWKNITDDFYNFFAEYYSEGERPDLLKNYILERINSFSDDQAKINELLSSDERKTGYIKFLRDVFNNRSNFQIFTTIRDRHLNDVKRYKRIQVLYDGKDIERASFGQKCTAVMVILLLFGNYPLIIDEPEAHLDSSLIANYLVPLIKQKKNNRQIIFATHNANFVINGDAEKIFILKNETGITEIIETTIEDLDNRNELLKLEGGREAFRKRGKKLHI